jgi:hypothetical protein
MKTGKSRIGSIGSKVRAPALAYSAMLLLLLAACGGNSEPGQATNAEDKHSLNSSVAVFSVEKPHNDVARAASRDAQANLPGPKDALRNGTAPFLVLQVKQREEGVASRGTRFDDRSANVMVDKTSGKENILKPGMLIQIEGEDDLDANSPRALSITTGSIVKGRIDQIDIQNSRMTVSGIPVMTNGDTVFDPVSLLGEGAFTVGDFVEVYGFSTKQKGVVASRIEKAKVTDQLRIAGPVKGLNANAKTFSLYGKVIRYADARPHQLLARLTNEMTVVVKGRVDPNASVFSASEIQAAGSDLSAKEGIAARVDGTIYDFAGHGNFNVNGIPVNAFKAPLSGALGNDVKVEVDGTISRGILIATRIERKVDEGKDAKEEGIDTPIRNRRVQRAFNGTETQDMQMK